MNHDLQPIFVLAIFALVAVIFFIVVIRIVTGVVRGVVQVTDGVGRTIARVLPAARPPAAHLGRRLGQAVAAGWPAAKGQATLRCPRPRCHAENAVSARYCRRCGTVMDDRAAAAAQRPTFGRPTLG